MNEQQILANLMKNPAYRKALQALMLEDKDLANEICPETTKILAYIWCAEMVDQNTGVTYYHPVIVPHKDMGMDLESMMTVSNYSMMASMDQFEAYENEPMVKMFASVYGDRYPIRLISVPEETYSILQAALVALVESILSEIQQCFVHMDNIARMANTDSTMMKMRLIGSVFGQMTTVASCFNRNMEVVDSNGHDYRIPENDEDWRDDYDEYDEEYEDEDDDGDNPSVTINL